MLTSSGGSGESSSSSAGRKRYDGQGRVTSLTTMTALRADAASSERRGEPMGSARARRISACSSAADGAAGGATSSPRPQPGRMTSVRDVVRQLEVERAVAVGDRVLHGAGLEAVSRSARPSP